MSGSGFLVGKWICRSRACEMTELEVPSMRRSLIGGMLCAGGAESEQMQNQWMSQKIQIHKGLQDHIWRVSDVKESVSESGFERQMCENEEFHTRSSHNPWVVRSLEDCQSFFESKPVDVDLSCSVFDARLGRGRGDFGQSLVTCPEAPQKRQSFLSRRRCLSWGVSFPSLPSLEDRLEWWAFVW